MYEKILLPVDGSEASRRGFEEALALAIRLQSTLRLLHVTGDFPFVIEMANPDDPKAYRSAVHRQAKELLGALAAQVSAAGLQVETHVCALRTTGLAKAIVQDAVRNDCRLIVMGTSRRRGLARALAGSVAEEVVRNGAVPVLVVGIDDRRMPPKP